MLREIVAAALIISAGSMSSAQTGEDHRAKSDVTSRAGTNGSTGSSSLEASVGADPNVPTSGATTVTKATAPHANNSNKQSTKARAKVKKVQAQQRQSDRVIR